MSAGSTSSVFAERWRCVLLSLALASLWLGVLAAPAMAKSIPADPCTILPLADVTYMLGSSIQSEEVPGQGEALCAYLDPTYPNEPAFSIEETYSVDNSPPPSTTSSTKLTSIPATLWVSNQALYVTFTVQTDSFSLVGTDFPPWSVTRAQIKTLATEVYQALSPLTITTVNSLTSPPNATVGIPYSFQLTATGGTGVYRWSVDPADLPDGLALSSRGLVSGTPAKESELQPFTVTVTSGTQSRRSPFSIWVLASGPASGSQTQAAAKGSGYCSKYAANPNQVTAPYELDDVYACTPYYTRNAGTPFDEADNISFQCVDLSVRFLWAEYGIWAGPGADEGNIDGADLATYVNQTYGTPVGTPEFGSQVGSQEPGTGGLPLPGDVISFAGPAVSGSSGHTAVVVKDVSSDSFEIMSENMSNEIGSGDYRDGSAGEQVIYVDTTGQHNGYVRFAGQGWTDTSAWWLELAGTTESNSLRISTPSTPSSPPPAIVGKSYSFTLRAVDGEQPFIWSVADGALPAGLTLKPTGVISGTPQSTAPSTFTAEVSDGAQIADQTYTIAPLTQLVAVSTPLRAIVGQSFTYTLTATGAVGTYTWGLVGGDLPPGLSLTNGVISGTAASVGAKRTLVFLVTSGPELTYADFTITCTAPSRIVN
ncbi:MAG TPA: putative Ig domain-containing protein [Candidatus Dormibacteraeota bacterium]|nr:putative Ig domain-containing protein [Candidatus Dormibacteraeota bacterium]